MCTYFYYNPYIFGKKGEKFLYKNFRTLIIYRIIETRVQKSISIEEQTKRKQLVNKEKFLFIIIYIAINKIKRKNRIII